MKKWLRRIRGAVGMGLTWAAAWSGVAFILSLVGFFGTLGLVRVYVVVAQPDRRDALSRAPVPDQSIPRVQANASERSLTGVNGHAKGW